MVETIKRYLKEDMMFYFAVVIALAVTAALYPSLPDVLPIHWNARGEPDGFAPKIIAVWLMPGGAVLTHLFTVIMMSLDPRKKHLEGSNVMSLLRTITPLFLLAIHGVMMLNWKGAEVDMLTSIFLLCGVLFMICGNFVGKIPQNYMAGVRLPWTLEDPKVWKKTNRLAARVLFACGFLMCLGAFLPTGWVVGWFLFLTAVMVIVPIGGAIYYYGIRHDL